MRSEATLNRAFSIGLWVRLMIVEKEAERLSEGARAALKLLREDLEKLANDNEQEG